RIRRERVRPRRRSTAPSSKEPPLLEARVRLARDHDVIEQLDSEEAPRFGDAAGDGQVFLAGRRIAGRMVVREDQARRGDGERGDEDLAGMDDARVQAPDGDDLPT